MSKPAVAPATDQAYFEASLENAMMDREVLEGRVAEAVAVGTEVSNEQLQRGIDRIRLVTDRP